MLNNAEGTSVFGSQDFTDNQLNPDYPTEDVNDVPEKRKKNYHQSLRSLEFSMISN